MFQTLLDSFTILDIVAALVTVAAVLVALAVVLVGVLYVLKIVGGSIPIIQKKPPKGYQYQFIAKDGKASYGTWTRKDDYLTGGGSRRR